MLKVIGCIQQHDLRLLLLACSLGGLTCLAATDMLWRAQAVRGARRWRRTALAAVEFACGIWSVHLVAMLGYVPQMPAALDPLEAALAVLAATAGTFAAFGFVVRRRRRATGLALAAWLLSLGVGTMHMLGIWAVRLNGVMTFDTGYAVAGILLCAVLSVVALAAMRELRSPGRQVSAAGLLGLAVFGLHFISMAGVELRPGGAAAPDGGIDARVLATTVAAVSAAGLLLSLALSLVERQVTKLHEQGKRRLRQLVEVSFEGLVIERDGLMLDVNQQICSLGNYPAATLTGQPFHMLVPDSALWRAAQVQSGTIDCNLRRRDGVLVPVELLVRPISYDKMPATAIAVRDLTVRKRDEAEIRRLALFDPLTGLANRTLLHQRLEQAIAAAAQTGRIAAVLCLDLDRFKPVNDLLGHPAGDALLVAVAKRLAGLLREQDTLARTGGDEFTVVLPGLGQDTESSVAQRIVDTLQEPFMLAEHQIVIGVSVGVALYPQHCASGSELLRCADIALYCAKEAGRNTVRMFMPAMDVQLQTRRALEHDLRQALAQGGLEVHYQPVVNAATRQVESYEALLRWHHPQRGNIPPSVFVPLAEESGLILPLGRWALETACADAACWAEPVRVAVNISPVQIRQPGYAAEVLEVLENSGLPPERLEIEITEGVLIDEPERTIEFLRALHEANVTICLDDFGSGYSSLLYLRRFPLDKIKIDKSFVDEVATNRQAASIVRSLVSLAHSLNLVVTAEGVETQAQLAALRQVKCDQVQGFLLGCPARMPMVPAAEALAS